MPSTDTAPRKPSSSEKRAATDAAAFAIMEKEVMARELKTERLRALRMAQAPAALEKKRRQVE